MIRSILFYIGYFYYLIILKTSRAKIIDREIVEKDFAEKKSCVFCCPHNFLLGLFAGIEIGKLKRPTITILTSLSKDGELIVKLLQNFNFEMVRGSSNRGAKKALLELTRAGLNGKCIGLAYDGPKGPPLIPKRGLIGCLNASSGEGEIYFIYGNIYPCKFIPFLKPFRVNSWDKFYIPVPFCRIEVCFEKIPWREHNLEKEQFILNYIERRGKEVYGHLYSKH